MSDTKMVVGPERQLKSKTNFITWRREFERAAKAQDVLDLLKGDEEILEKPNKTDYLYDSGGGKTTQMQAVTATNNNAILWQADSKAWKDNKDKLKIAGKLLNEWVCEGIKIEIEDCDNAKEAYDFIKIRYKISDERARDILLTQLNDLKLEAFTTMTEYVNKLRQLKADLKIVKYIMTDDMFASTLLHGLPIYYRNFKEQYD